MKLRSTEERVNPFWEQIKSQFEICDLQGLLIGAPKNHLEKAVQDEIYELELTGVEAVELDINDSLENIVNIFKPRDWKLKLEFVGALNSRLYLVAYLSQFYIYRVKEQKAGDFPDIALEQTLNDIEFVRWWADRKKIIQTKPMYEAKIRQADTIFDGVLEGNGLAWGGNIDGVLFDRKHVTSALIEVRTSKRQPVNLYDPKRYFFGTARKSGDYMTWLPLWYVAKKLDVPLVLLTFSTYSKGECGAAVVENITSSGLMYKGRPPNMTLFNSIKDLKSWFESIIGRSL